MDSNPILDDKSCYGTFEELTESNKEKLKAIFDEAQKNTTPNSIARKIGDFFKSEMYSISIECEGILGLEPILNEIKSIQNTDDLSYVIGYMHTHQLYHFFYFYATADKKIAI